jgi:hypothetical protein
MRWSLECEEQYSENTSRKSEFRFGSLDAFTPPTQAAIRPL